MFGGPFGEDAVDRRHHAGWLAHDSPTSSGLIGGAALRPASLRCGLPYPVSFDACRDIGRYARSARLGGCRFGGRRHDRIEFPLGSLRGRQFARPWPLAVTGGDTPWGMV